jgi:transposase
MVESGIKQVQVAGIVGVSKDTISLWVRKKRSQGKKYWRVKNQGRSVPGN